VEAGRPPRKDRGSARGGRSHHRARPRLEVTEAATAYGPATVGLQARRSGLLRAGFDADLLVVDGDPLSEIALLADLSKITAVWQAGIRVRG
jgi:imidazolonepropionase-like amidohydrolase